MCKQTASHRDPVFQILRQTQQMLDESGSINQPVEVIEPTQFVWVRRPGGSLDLMLDRQEVDAYNADPDGFAARYFGVTRDEYRQWVIADGTLTCHGLNQHRELCSLPIHDGEQLPSREWVKRWGEVNYCRLHSFLDYRARGIVSALYRVRPVPSRCR